MRILFVNEKAGYFGGVEQNISDTVRGLTSRGHPCFLAYGARTDKDADGFLRLFDEAVPCRDLAPPGEQRALPLAGIVDRLAPQSLYIHKARTIAPVLPLLGRLPCVRMVHDHDLCCPRRHKYHALTGRVCHRPAGWRCLLDGAFLEKAPGSPFKMRYAGIEEKISEMRSNWRLDRLLVGSRFMLEELLQNGCPPEKVAILPPVIRKAPLPLSPLPEAPVVLFVGQLIRGKGVDLLLRALRRLTIPFEAFIVGTGNGEPGLRTSAERYGLGGRVHFEGWVPNEALEGYYARAGCVVVPSRWPEPFGLIGLEAMRHGRPVAAFRVGGIPDWLEDGKTGLLVEEQDVPGLARAITRLLTDKPLARSLGEQGEKRFRDRFSFEGYLDHLLRCL